MATVLLVEDDPQVRSMLHDTLEEEGHTIKEAENGREAIDAYRKDPADIVVTDIIMPGKDGVEALHILKRDFPDIKVIAISGGSANIRGEHLLDTAKKLGAARVFNKPVDLEELTTAINEVLAGS